MVGVDGAGGVPEVEAGVWVRVGGDEGEGVILPGLLVVGGIFTSSLVTYPNHYKVKSP